MYAIRKRKEYVGAYCFFTGKFYQSNGEKEPELKRRRKLAKRFKNLESALKALEECDCTFEVVGLEEEK
jgi:hypothetical protein